MVTPNHTQNWSDLISPSNKQSERRKERKKKWMISITLQNANNLRELTKIQFLDQLGLKKTNLIQIIRKTNVENYEDFC